VPSFWLPRLGAYLAALGGSLGIAAGLAELTVGPGIRAWVGNKQDTNRLGLATITLSAIALLAAFTWWRRKDASVATRLLIVVGLFLPGAICFTTVGQVWYLPGALLVVAAGLARSSIRSTVTGSRRSPSSSGRSTFSSVQPRSAPRERSASSVEA
jgi:hypothetical protein